MDGGYDTKRFIDPVRQDLLCCICKLVLKDPRTCEAEEHYFCFHCISQRLDNSPTCPRCLKHLNPKALKLPQFFLLLILSEQRIKCDYTSRGCIQYVQLKNLQNHVNGCEYRPVKCENCGQQVNAKDKKSHQKSFCHFGGALYQDLKDIKLQLKEMKDEFKIIQEQGMQNLLEKVSDIERKQDIEYVDVAKIKVLKKRLLRTAIILV